MTLKQEFIPGVSQTRGSLRALTENTVWRDINKSMTLEAFDLLYSDMLARAKGNDPYAQDLGDGAWSAPTDGASLCVTALTASKLARAEKLPGIA
ncbi:MAG: hypothetical protein L0Y50_06720, partial [Beijerinckiaceae bacterium]|nr:hypothetical protein [Beijerinckiaceae bacterium]